MPAGGEARTLWGQIVNNSRSVARQAVSLLRTSDPEQQPALESLQRRIVYHQVAYVHALRQHLRGLAPWDDLAPFLSPAELDSLRREKNVPLTLQRRLSDLLVGARLNNWIDALEWQAIDGNLDDLTDAQGGAERIKNTPMPKQYDYFPMLFVPDLLPAPSHRPR